MSILCSIIGVLSDSDASIANFKNNTINNDTPGKGDHNGLPLLYTINIFGILINWKITLTQYKTCQNKAIRDGKYLAPPHASAWQRLPH